MHQVLLATALLVTAGAALDARAAARPVSGTLAIQIGTFLPVAIPGAGTVIVNGSSGVGHLTALDLPADLFAGSGVWVADPEQFPINGVQLTAANDAGSFGGIGGSGSFGGVMALAGVAKVCLFGPCSAAVSNLIVPLNVVGAGGYYVVVGGVYMTVVGAPWTTGTAAVGTATAMGGIAPASSTDMITLVTPILIRTDLGALPVIPAFGFLTLTGLNVPEPGTLALLGSGIVALVAMGRRTRR